MNTQNIIAMKNKTNLIPTWLKIGNLNPWIKRAVDPVFTKKCFYECKSIEELKEKLSSGNWCLAQAFYFKNICFINQVNAGDEWLVIRGSIDFESINAIPIIKKGKFEDLMHRILNATDKDLKTLEY